jgi:hypothetical protein
MRKVKFHAHLASQFSAPLSECDAGLEVLLFLLRASAAKCIHELVKLKCAKTLSKFNYGEIALSRDAFCMLCWYAVFATPFVLRRQHNNAALEKWN